MSEENKPAEAAATQTPEFATAPVEAAPASTAEPKDSEVAKPVTHPDSKTEAAATKEKSPSPSSKNKKYERDDRDDRKRKRYDDDDRPRRGQYQKKQFNNKKKADYSKLPESSDHEEIRAQVEFYFSDSNLLSDKYLWDQSGGGRNEPVPIKNIHSFGRMQRFQPYSAVVEALKESEILEVIGDEVRRKIPLEIIEGKTQQEMHKHYQTEATKRSIYAKGFDEESATTQLEIEEFFKPYGPLRAVRMRRNDRDNEFKRSVFVEFDNENIMREFMELETKPKWGGKELLIKTKDDYCEGKVEDINAGRIKPGAERSFGFDRNQRGNNSRGRGRGRGGNRGRDDRRNGRDRRDRSHDRSRSRSRSRGDWKDRRRDFQKAGYKDRDGRNGRDNHGRHERSDDRRPKQEVDENGIPIVKITNRTPSPARKPAKAESPNSKKRARDDAEGENGPDEVKKVKSDEVAAAA